MQWKAIRLPSSSHASIITRLQERLKNPGDGIRNFDHLPSGQVRADRELHRTPEDVKRPWTHVGRIPHLTIMPAPWATRRPVQYPARPRAYYPPGNPPGPAHIFL